MEQPRNDRYHKSSVSGSTGTRDRKRVVKISYQNYIRSVRAIALSTAITVGAVIGGGAKAVEKMGDNLTINTLVADFHRDCIAPETHRTQDNEHYYYDYQDIAHKIKEMDDPNIGYYLFRCNTSDYQTDRLLATTSYGSLEQYLQEHHWESSADWRKSMRERVLLEADMDDKKAEIEKMNQEHNIQDTAISYGGTK